MWRVRCYPLSTHLFSRLNHLITRNQLMVARFSTHDYWLALEKSLGLEVNIRGSPCPYCLLNELASKGWLGMTNMTGIAQSWNATKCEHMCITFSCGGRSVNYSCSHRVVRLLSTLVSYAAVKLDKLLWLGTHPGVNQLEPLLLHQLTPNYKLHSREWQQTTQGLLNLAM